MERIKMENIYQYVFMCFCVLGLGHAQDPVVNTKQGDIIGKAVTLPHDFLPYPNLKLFRGIPFAEPPVGEKRFRKPEPTTLPESPFYAHNFSKICPQLSFLADFNTEVHSEDCLYLNVYVPDRQADMPSGHAVLIWVYGGGFITGSANLYDASILSVAENIIVVTFNYRLGALGFLNTGDDYAPGNAGLWDQRMAFQWVSDNIGEFGGDSNRITIAGQSAGAMSVTQHALYSDNFGLFQRVIAQSGSISTHAFNYERDSMKDAVYLADQLNCPTFGDDMMNCLKMKSVNDLSAVSASLPADIFFGPTIDGELMKLNPQHISKMAESRELDEVEFLRSLDILSGFNAFEGAFMLPYTVDPSQIETMQPSVEAMREQYIPGILRTFFRREYGEELIHLVDAQYTNWSNPESYQNIRLQITKLLGDVNFAIPAIELSRLHQKSSDSSNYMYHFAPKPSVRALPTASWIPGANHGDEILFEFGALGIIGVGSENAWEIELITKMMTYWSNFVKTGDPNSPLDMSPYWPPYTAENGDYMELSKSTSAKQHFYAEDVHFWMNVFPQITEAMDGSDSNPWCGDTTSAGTSLSLQGATLAITALVTLCGLLK